MRRRHREQVAPDRRIAQTAVADHVVELVHGRTRTGVPRRWTASHRRASDHRRGRRRLQVGVGVAAALAEVQQATAALYGQDDPSAWTVASVQASLGTAPTVELPRLQVVGVPLVQVAVASGLCASKGAPHRTARTCASVDGANQPS